jgi:hypothetical protein
MPGMIGRWTHRKGVWRYMVRRPRQRLVAIAYRVRHGWEIRLEGELAGPYGNLDLARQSAEKRVEASGWKSDNYRPA